MSKINLLADEIVINKIYLIRNQKIMIDRDLADMYGVETRVFRPSRVSRRGPCVYQLAF